MNCCIASSFLKHLLNKEAQERRQEENIKNKIEDIYQEPRRLHPFLNQKQQPAVEYVRSITGNTMRIPRQENPSNVSVADRIRTFTTQCYLNYTSNDKMLVYTYNIHVNFGLEYFLIIYQRIPNLNLQIIVMRIMKKC